jgi:hypothetical protein
VRTQRQSRKKLQNLPSVLKAHCDKRLSSSELSWVIGVRKRSIHMSLFAKVFSTRMLVPIACVLGAVVVMKVLSAHYDFSWATALAAE